MNIFLKKFQNLKENREKMLYSLLPNLLMRTFANYLRVEIDGPENIPHRGPVIIIPNHSGYAGLDAMVLSHEIIKHKKRPTRVMTHYMWFAFNLTKSPANKLGFVEASKKNGLQELQKNRIVVLFPEGERGNFKPTKYAYKLQKFKRGYIRMALEKQCPIIPTVIIGAEETHLNLKKIKLPKKFKGASFPIPLNVFPLPVMWKIKFLEPIYLPHPPEAANDSELVHKLNDEIQKKMQLAIENELKKRPGIFIHRPNWMKHLLHKLSEKLEQKSG